MAAPNRSSRIPCLARLWGQVALLTTLTACERLSAAGTCALSIRSSVFLGTPVRAASTYSNDEQNLGTAAAGPYRIEMRKQKASDKRTRRRQRYGNDNVLLADLDVAAPPSPRNDALRSRTTTTTPTTSTTSPMQARGDWKLKQVKESTSIPTRGRGRSRKRSALYQALAFYHHKFVDLLTEEYQVEENEVLSRIKASIDNPLALEAAGHALFDLIPQRRGNLYADEVYRVSKAPDATTLYPSPAGAATTNELSNRFLPPNHKFGGNDVIVLTLQPRGSGEFFDPACLPTADTALQVEGRVLNVGPTYVDVVVPAGRLAATFGAPAPNDISGRGDPGMRVRADRFFSDVPYTRMVEAISQMTRLAVKSNFKKANDEENVKPTDSAAAFANICMDELLREAILSTHAVHDANSPLLHYPDLCDVAELSHKLSKPPMATSHKLAQQTLQHIAAHSVESQKPGGIFPVFNGSQRAVIEACLTRRLTLVTGPPGGGKTTTAAAIVFGFVQQCPSISGQHTKVLATAFSNVGADNLAEAMLKLGLRVVRVGKPSAVSENLWEVTLDAAIAADEWAQKAAHHAAEATAALQKATVRLRQQKGNKAGADALSDRTLRDAATRAVEASMEADNLAATRALRQADVIVSTSTGAADPRLLLACGLRRNDDDDKALHHSFAQQHDTRAERGLAPDGQAPLSLPFVIVDEACQSVEPATLIPITASNSCRSLVLIGDPCQLPPTVRSEAAAELSVSLMERLSTVLQIQKTPIADSQDPEMCTHYLDHKSMKLAQSALRAWDRGAHTPKAYRKRFSGSLMLTVQYRMHPSIAAFSSSIFYDGQLQTPAWMKQTRRFPPALNRLMPCGNPDLCVRVLDVGGRYNERRGTGSNMLQGTAVVAASDSLEPATSYCNEAEARSVVALIRDLLAGTTVATSIGVVTPYTAQVRLIEGMLQHDKDVQRLSKNMPGTTIACSSVDGYQGRERDVIVFSAVRSNRRGNIGFLTDWRRMNVALTRAKSALIVVGDMETLAEADKHWAAFDRWATEVRCKVNDWDDPDDEASL